MYVNVAEESSDNGVMIHNCSIVAVDSTQRLHPLIVDGYQLHLVLLSLYLSLSVCLSVCVFDIHCGTDILRPLSVELVDSCPRYWQRRSEGCGRHLLGAANGRKL